MTGVITKNDVSQLRLKGKPRCLCCNTPLTFVYQGNIGIIGEKCRKCGQSFLVDTETLEVLKILEDN